MNIIRRIKQTLSRLSSLTRDSDKVLFDFYDFEITKRELIVAVILLGFMLLLGIRISNTITDAVENQKRQYTQALKVSDQDMFEYGMATNVGNAFCYGTLAAVDAVSFEAVPGTYLYAREEREEYHMHTEEVEHTDSEGHTYYTTETYWSWDYCSIKEKHSNYITFLGVRFEYQKINRPVAKYIDTVYLDSYTRFLYYGVDPEHIGTIYCKLQGNTIPDHTTFYEDKTIDEVETSLCSNGAVIIFWIVWLIICVACVYGFFYLANDWLE